MIKYNKYKNQIKEWKKSLDSIQFEKKLESFRCQNVKELIFDEYINKSNKVNTITSYFNK